LLSAKICWKTCGGIFDIDGKKVKVAELEGRMSDPDFWKHPDKAQDVVSRLKAVRSSVERWQELWEECEDLAALTELAQQEDDPPTWKEIESDLGRLEKEAAALQVESLLSGKNDRLGALLTIHPGAGGTESQDWAQMLMRMYLRWIDRRGYNADVLDVQPGEEAGIKDATIEVKGENAYGYLKAESGVHRLVRISPFDASHRRHTSFASSFVYPLVEDTVEVVVRDEDLRVDTFRSSGAGGQHVNKTDSAVRMTHLPTGIVVQSQAERSQHRNRDNAMRILKTRLYHYYEEKEREKLSQLENSKKDIAWGSQIRSYVFHPYCMVKDHRTNAETGQVQKVMDGDLNMFIDAYLRGMSS
jgi:peptide chain release factor 2